MVAHTKQRASRTPLQHQRRKESTMEEEEIIGEGHNQLEWAKVRKRAILQTTTMADWEKANDFQRKVLHQIELAIISVQDDQ